jgi:hypothetical protein
MSGAFRGMGMQIVQFRTLDALGKAADRLDREWDELQKLREAVAEAERCNLDRQQRAEPRPLS